MVGCARQQDAGDMNESAEGSLSSSRTCPVCARRLSASDPRAVRGGSPARQVQQLDERLRQRLVLGE